MPYFRIAYVIWGLEDDPDGSIQHIARHGVTTAEADDVLLNPANESRWNHDDQTWNTEGVTSAGRWLLVAWDWADEAAGAAYILTAYGPGEEN